MRTSILYLSILFAFSSFSYAQNQNSKTKEKINYKEKEIKEAENDFKNGDYFYNISGLGASLGGPKEYNAILTKILLKDYNIKTRNTGCFVSPNYSERMNELLEEKYGKDYLKNAQHKSAEIYKQSDEFKNKILPAIKKDSIFKRESLLERDFSKQRNNFIDAYLKKNLPEDIVNSPIVVHYILGKDGNVTLKEIIAPKESDKKLLVKEAFNKIPKLLPPKYMSESIILEASYVKYPNQ